MKKLLFFILLSFILLSCSNYKTNNVEDCKNDSTEMIDSAEIIGTETTTLN